MAQTLLDHWAISELRNTAEQIEEGLTGGEIIKRIKYEYM
jgi:hypothetical protein